jgi:hypothetical protein
MPPIAPARGRPLWDDAPEPAPDRDLHGWPEREFEFDQRAMSVWWPEASLDFLSVVVSRIASLVTIS